jgi:hypothetical protein
MQKKIFLTILILSLFCAPQRILAENALSIKTEKYSFKPGETMEVKNAVNNIFGKPFAGRLAVYFEPLDKSRAPIINEYPINFQKDKKNSEFSTKLDIDSDLKGGIWVAASELKDLNGQTAAKASFNFLITGTKKYFSAKIECYKDKEGTEKAVVFLASENIFCRLDASELPDKADAALSGQKEKSRKI